MQKHQRGVHVPANTWLPRAPFVCTTSSFLLLTCLYSANQAKCMQHNCSESPYGGLAPTSPFNLSSTEGVTLIHQIWFKPTATAAISPLTAFWEAGPSLLKMLLGMSMYSWVAREQSIKLSSTTAATTINLSVPTSPTPSQPTAVKAALPEAP